MRDPEAEDLVIVVYATADPECTCDSVSMTSCRVEPVTCESVRVHRLTLESSQVDRVKVVSLWSHDAETCDSVLARLMMERKETNRKTVGLIFECFDSFLYE